MSTITRIWAHDPIGNNEAQVTNYDTTTLEQAEAAGIIFIAEYDDGTRTRIAAKDITEPTPETGSYVFVAPVYVDTRMQATSDVFDAISTIINTNPTTLTNNNDDEPADDETTTINPDGTPTLTPIQKFNQALAAFKAAIGTEATNGNA